MRPVRNRNKNGMHILTTAAAIVAATTATVEATVNIFVDTATTAALLLTTTTPTLAACGLLLILDVAGQRLAGTDCLAEYLQLSLHQGSGGIIGSE